MTTAIEVEALSKRYEIGARNRPTTLREAVVSRLRHPLRRTRLEEFWALQEVSFEVAKGEVVGIVGRNGAGKSTLLRLLARITAPTSGALRVHGRAGALLEVGTGFHPELTGRENIFLNGSILGMRKAEIARKLEAIVDFAGVERFLETPIKRYSSGMRLRLGFAVAAHLEPEILLVDEVLAVGDAAFQKKCLDAMSEMQGGGRTVLFVSHNLEAIEHLCPRTLWIERGRIQRDGPTDEVVSEYLSSFARPSKSGLHLRDFEARTGTGEVRIVGADVLTREGAPKGVVRSGDGLRLRVHYAARERIPEPVFGLALSSELGTRVTQVSTWDTGQDISSLAAGDGHLDLEVDFLNLQPGRYYLTLWVWRSGGERYDHLENCVVLDVEASNYFGSGRGINKQSGLVFFACRWHLPEGAVGA